MARTFIMRQFICPNCLKIVTAAKKANQKTKVGHIKHMWCPYCKSYQGFIQQETDSGLHR